MIAKKILLISACLLSILIITAYFITKNNNPVAEKDFNGSAASTVSNDELINEKRYQATLTQQQIEMTQAIHQLSKSINQLRTHNQQFRQEIDSLARKMDMLNTKKGSPNEHKSNSQLNQPNPTDSFESMFYNDTEDHEWSSIAEEHFHSSLRDLAYSMTDLSVAQVACTGSMCRLEYKLASMENLKPSIEHITNNLTWDSKSYSEYETKENGDIIIKSYYLRENVDYPKELVGLN